jgi:hypothetical protein
MKWCCGQDEGQNPFWFTWDTGRTVPVPSAHTHNAYQLKYAGDPHTHSHKTKGNRTKKSHSYFMKSREVSRQAQIDSLI